MNATNGLTTHGPARVAGMLSIWGLACRACIFWACSLGLATQVEAQVSFDGPPINYLRGTFDDPIARLQKRIETGGLKLSYDPQRGYLTSLLEKLGVSTSSQVLVFSKTSFQLKKISPRTPRAVYFGDDIYIGWVQGGDVVEISSVDPVQGAAFYTLSQKWTAKPKFTRHNYQCLQCHSGSMTRGVPGHLVRSVYATPDGRTDLRAGSFLTDQSSPLKERWGGWYVTGTHGKQRHMGNLLVRESDDLNALNMEGGANVTDLSSRFETSPYLSPHSDLVALMVLEHQTQMHNLITRSSYLTRLAVHDDEVINEMMGDPLDRRSESSRRRVDSGAASLVKYMLFSGEVRLTDKVVGSSEFVHEFEKKSPRDSKGRSLRDFDLENRLFQYPCSYLIYSEAFDSIPAEAAKRVYSRLWKVLSGEDTSDDFRHLSKADRRNILEILRETKKGLPDYWFAESVKKTEAQSTEKRRINL